MITQPCQLSVWEGEEVYAAARISKGIEEKQGIWHNVVADKGSNRFALMNENSSREKKA
ncbi:MAG: hypothetical protein K2I22_01305 [Lachnospiraceae bacterium]|nr:hypothetical protein [Lachnospiraceae bacterium]